ncbi:MULTISPECIES: FecR domain-containing protein [Variovorax]|jgi:transmembrane sensor|uniref:FecR domain-containing protein n=1 Tax=Variovorax TaxID=34072 RepID=UPI0008696824|nr:MULTISPECIES: FecR domain-containing protein [Variovorax]MBN8754658.1 FecR domain-containing protein [Variovorax sp.]ODU19375.1 MAG: histidine kinase [Variovorax sp. SCN 67-85]ODV25276.1 MAG: histidine kinase [Variovorax sp. SCN 67-20]OJZ03095.1 MAG: histidine kinase [Variovorax sp. 67-131]UKI08178.1 FecR domain-containing protein [Variovorax paradoxus]
MTEAPVPRHVAQRATEWLLDLQGEPAASRLRDEWQRWRAAHPDHERAWQRIEAVNGQLHRLATPVGTAMAHAALTRTGSRGRRQAVTALAVLLFAGGAAWTVGRQTRWGEEIAAQRTGLGERRTTTLDDGTVLVLNTGTAVDVKFSATERRVRLLSGELLITTAKDALGRPFLIETAQGEAQALGTRYTVRQFDGASDIAVFEGAVRITPRRAAWRTQVLQAGQKTRFAADTIDAPQWADADSTAWTEGFIVAKGMRLADFLAELGRYSARPLSSDPAVADLRVSGSYPLADIDKVLDTLSAVLSLEVQVVTRFWGLQTVRVSLAPRKKISPGVVRS